MKQRTIIRLVAVLAMGLAASGCIGITKGNPLSLVPASELALIRNSAPVDKKAISVDDLLARARASGAETAAPKAPQKLDLAYAGDGIEPEPGHLVSVGSFVAAAPDEKIIISCGSGLDEAGLLAHRRGLAVRKLLELIGANAELRRDGELDPATIRLTRGDRRA